MPAGHTQAVYAAQGPAVAVRGLGNISNPLLLPPAAIGGNPQAGPGYRPIHNNYAGIRDQVAQRASFVTSGGQVVRVHAYLVRKPPGQKNKRQIVVSLFCR